MDDPTLEFVAPQIVDATEDVAIVRPRAQRGRRNLSQKAQKLTEEARESTKDLPISHPRRNNEPHMATFASSLTSTLIQELSLTERTKSDEREKQS